MDGQVVLRCGVGPGFARVLQLDFVALPAGQSLLDTDGAFALEKLGGERRVATADRLDLRNGERGPWVCVGDRVEALNHWIVNSDLEVGLSYEVGVCLLHAQVGLQILVLEDGQVRLRLVVAGLLA